jgi:alginate O-acetyltransferase complex protein AlgI
MVFNSYTFLVFFLVVLAMHHAPFPWRVKKFNLLWASYLFYAAWNPPFVALLWLTTVVDWLCAKGIARADGKSRKAILILSLASNFALLGYFKYGGFLLENFVSAVNTAGIQFHPPAPDIILPVGISFYTFQSLSYTIDVYRKAIQPSRTFLDFALYVTFFPQLVAGPIVRASDFLPQLDTPRKATSNELTWGINLLMLGLFEKCFLADAILAPVAQTIFDGPEPASFLDAWCGTLAFTGQIFCDFAGYSTCAIGAAMCLGFWLPQNFHFPYGAVGFSDFWRRWHVSLSTWLRDYLYISLGGNRGGSRRTYLNLIITMLLGGLWHGASWTFIAWGGAHGLLLCLERSLKARFNSVVLTPPLRAAIWLGTFICICYTWVLFRADSFDRSMSIAGAMTGFADPNARRILSFAEMSVIASVMSVLVGAHWLLRDSTLEDLAARSPWWLRSAMAGALGAALILVPGDDRAFIYFQF